MRVCECDRACHSVPRDAAAGHLGAGDVHLPSSDCRAELSPLDGSTYCVLCKQQQQKIKLPIVLFQASWGDSTGESKWNSRQLILILETLMTLL